MVTVMVELPVPAVSVWGAKETSVPDGAPDAARATDWATPLVTAVETVDVVADPALTEPDVVEALREKSLMGDVEPGAA